MLIDKQEEKQLNPPPHSSPSTSSSSPSHEFSFTISLYPTAATNTNPPEKNNKAPPPPPQFAAIDLSPADDIFFHGHLLPLHLLSHLSAISPRSSFDSFTLPIKELSSSSSSKENNYNTSSNTHHQESILLEGKAKPSEKPKIPFSLFGLPRWRKGDNHNQEHNSKHKPKPKPKPKSKFDLMQRYMRLIKPFLVSFRSSNNRRGNNSTKNFSFSGGGGDVKAVRSKKGLLKRGRRGEYSSAPASMRNSPTNSGVLVQGGGGGSSGNITPTYNKSDSTMEELQAAIQAAIAHCKKSISTEPDH
ncbi:hypothetical protein ACP275_14G267400 [Erythranthe tilingii]